MLCFNHRLLGLVATSAADSIGVQWLQTECSAYRRNTSRCTETDEPVETELRLSGSSTIAPLILEIAQRFEKQHPGITVDVQTGGSGKGIADVRTGIAEIGMASRGLKGDEQDLTATTMARDGVGFIVHKSNPVTELSRQQIIDIYQDRIGNWSDLGGPELPIVVVHRPKDEPPWKCFWNISRSPIRRFKRM